MHSPKTKEAYQELLQKRRQLNNTLAEALLRPSFDSTKKYMEAQKELTKRNQKFVRYWQQVLVSNPELDYSLNAPTDNSAIEERNKEKSQFIEKLLNMASKKYGLIFVYQGKSRASIRFSNLIKTLKTKYKFSIAPISIDGEVLSSFPKSIKAHKDVAEKKLGVKGKYTPALFLFDIKSKSITPLSYGFISETDLKHRFLDVLTKFKRHSFEGIRYGEQL